MGKLINNSFGRRLWYYEDDMLSSILWSHNNMTDEQWEMIRIESKLFFSYRFELKQINMDTWLTDKISSFL
jgi:hypothetical protein